MTKVKASYSTTIRYIKNGENAVLYRLSPSTAALSFAVDAAGAYQPTYFDISCGYSKTESGTTETYDGTNLDNLWKDGGAPYNIFFRLFNERGTAGNYAWAKDLTTNGNGILRVQASQKLSKVEFYLSSAIGVSTIASSNIVDTISIPVSYDGINGEGADYYVLQPNVDIIGFSKSTDGNSLSPTSRTIYVYVKHITTSSVETKQPIPDGYSVRYSFSLQPTTTSAGTEYSKAFNVSSGTTYTTLYLSLFNGETLVDTKIVPIVKSGLDGADNTGITVGIKNAHGLFSMDADGKVSFSSTFENVVTVQYGTTYETITSLTATASDSSVGVHTNASSGLITVELTKGSTYDEDSFDVYVTVTSEHCDSKTIGFTMQGVRCGADGEWYELEPSSDSLSFGVDTDGSYTPGSRTIWCGYSAYKGSEKTFYDGQQIENTMTPNAPYNIFFRTLAADGETYSGWNWIKNFVGTNGAGYTVIATNKMQGIEFAFSSASSVANITDSNIYDRQFCPFTYDGINGSNGEKGDKGDKGDKGEDGTNGKGIDSTTITYAQSLSGSQAPTSGWQSTVPSSLAQGYYLWTKTVIQYTDGTTSTGYSVARNGTDGTNNIIADIDRETASIVCDSNGKPTSTQTISFDAHLYDGTSEIDFDIEINSTTISTTYATISTGISVKRDDNTLTFKVTNSWTNSNTASFALEFVYGSTRRVCTFTLYKVIPGADGIGIDGENGEDAVMYEIVPSECAIKVDEDGNYSASSIDITLNKIVGQSITSLDKVPSGYYLYYEVGNTSKVVNAGSSVPSGINVLNATGVVTLSFLTTPGEVIVDNKTIPIVVDGKKGEKGDKGDAGDSGTSAILRVRSWDDIATGAYVYSGASGESFLDVVILVSSGTETYWQCKVTHKKTSSETPSASNTNWQSFSDFKAVATKVLLAEETKINNLYVDKVKVYKNGIEVVNISSDGVKIVSGDGAKQRAEINNSEINLYDGSNRGVTSMCADFKTYDSIVPTEDILEVPQIANTEFATGVPKANGLSSYVDGMSYSVDSTSTLENQGFISASEGITINSSTAEGMGTTIADNDKNSETPIMYLTDVKTFDYRGIWSFSVKNVLFSSFGRSTSGGQKVTVSVTLYLCKMDSGTTYKTATELITWTNTSNTIISTTGKYKYTHVSWDSLSKSLSVSKGDKYRLGVKIDSSDTANYTGCSYYVNVSWTLNLGYIYLDSYKATMFKNGLALIADKNNMFVAMANVGSSSSTFNKEFTFDVRAGNYEIGISKDGWQINGFAPSMPILLFKASVSYSNSAFNVNTYYSAVSGAKPTITAVSGSAYQVQLDYSSYGVDRLTEGNSITQIIGKNGSGYQLSNATILSHDSGYLTLACCKGVVSGTSVTWSAEFCNFYIAVYLLK